MATAKKPAEKEEKVEEIIEEAIPAEEKKVRIRLPHGRDKAHDGPLFVSVNDRTWLIQRGVEVEVPECCAEIIRQSERAEEEQYAWNAENAK